ncbi:MAG: hypothetical protein ACOX5A_11855 [Aminivibrio sp.]|jgi:hypothetical protein
MSRAAAFIRKLKAEGVYIQVGRAGLNLNGPDEAVKGARAVLDKFPSLADEVKALLRPSIEDMQEWLGRQDDAIRAEYRARVERLTAAGIPEPERVALRTTYQDNLDVLPERLRPITGASK